MDDTASTKTFWPFVFAALFAPLLIYLGFIRQDLLASVQVLLVLTLVILASLDMWWMLMGSVAIRAVTEMFESSPLFTALGVPFNLSTVTGVVVILWSGAVLWRHRAIAGQVPYRGVLIALFVVQAASLFWSIAPQATVEELLRSLSVLMLYASGWTIFRLRTSNANFVPALVAALCVPVLFGIVEWATGTGMQVEGEPSRAFGTFSHPNTFGLVLAIGLTILVLALMLNSERRPRWLLPSVGLFGVMLLLTYSRGGWLVFALAAGFVLLRSFHRTVFRVLAILAVIAAFLGITREFVYERWNVDVARFPVVSRLSAAGSDEGSLSWRLALWQSVRQDIEARPLQGFGLAVFPTLNERENFLSDGINAHNDYLRLLVETGAIGLAVFLVLFGSIVVDLARRARRMEHETEQLLLYGTLALTVGFLVESFFDNVQQATFVMWLYWLWLAYVLASAEKRKAPEPATELVEGLRG